uniref:Uncharacterized protein AlNc14C53G4121 n=1 Tax=Albugo laibachii Nc14 TaxID=890382 RepID=F0WBT0_9STRA|nr:conserved hypothetical protein [Albugo laibachii Nc14]CCA20564.1 conserved hypothetical protein [Albugo laibachii Nc14]|eukprot:CCA20564.1 conserved hypothetical protein [Albugo laibachii Nc14]
MNAKLINLVEIIEFSRKNDATKVAWCLLSGEFICASTIATSVFNLRNTNELFKQNFYDYIEIRDSEKVRSHVKNRSEASCGSEVPLIVRCRNVSRPMWIRLIVAPLTLRMIRCVDATQLSNSRSCFADASCIYCENLNEHAAQILEIEYPHVSEDVIATYQTSPEKPLELESIFSDATEHSLSSFAFEADWNYEVIKP